MTSSSSNDSETSHPSITHTAAPPIGALSTHLRTSITGRLNKSIGVITATAELVQQGEQIASSSNGSPEESNRFLDISRSQATVRYPALEGYVREIREKVSEWTSRINQIDNEQTREAELDFRTKYFEKKLEKFLEEEPNDDFDEDVPDDALTRFFFACERTLEDLKTAKEYRSDHGSSAPHSISPSVNGDGLAGDSRKHVNAPSASVPAHQMSMVENTPSHPLISDPTNPSPKPVTTVHEVSTLLSTLPPTVPQPGTSGSLMRREALSKENGRHEAIEFSRMNGQGANAIHLMSQPGGERKGGEERTFPPDRYYSNGQGDSPHKGEVSTPANVMVPSETKEEEDRRKEDEWRRTQRPREVMRDQGGERRDQRAIEDNSQHRGFLNPVAFQSHPHPSFGTTVTPTPMLSMPSLTLPAMPMPGFDGKCPWEFHTFLSTFEAMVLPQPGLTDLSKLFYLRSCLKGEALDAVSSIIPGEGCYAAAVERLTNIYERGVQLKAAQLRQKLQQVKKSSENSGLGEELKAIRELQGIVAQLLSLPSETDSPYLTDAVVSKMTDKAVKKAVKNRIKDPYIGTRNLLDQLEDFMMNEIMVERVTRYNHTGFGAPSQKKEHVKTVLDQDDYTEGEKEKGEDPPPSILAMLPNRSTLPTSGNKSKCAYCDKHAAGSEETCRWFATPDERVSRCRQLRICFRCLVGGASHKFNKCEATCDHCAGAHHKSLCRKLSNSRSSNKDRVACIEEEEERSERGDESYYDAMEKEWRESVLTIREIVGTTCAQSIPLIPRIRSSKLLTFQALVVHPKTGMTHPVNVMMDNGSSVSLISEKLANTLQLPCAGKAETGFVGVGGMESDFRDYKIIEFALQSPATSMSPLKLRAYEFPSPLTGPERRFEIDQKDREFIKRAKLDSCVLEDSDGPAEILLSIEACAQLMSSGQQAVRLPSGMMLQPTEFGYVRIGAPRSHLQEAANSFVPNQILTISQSERCEKEDAKPGRRESSEETISDLPSLTLTTKSHDSGEEVKKDENLLRTESVMETVETYTKEVKEQFYPQGNVPSRERKKNKGDDFDDSLEIRQVRLVPPSISSSITLIYCILALFTQVGFAMIIEESITCLAHGVTVNSTQGYGIQICSSIECQTFPPESNNGSITAIFPPSISAGPYDVHVKLVTENDSFALSRTCPATDICTNMGEDWSLDHIVVPHCHPLTTLFLIGMIVYVIAMGICLVSYMVCYRQVTIIELIRTILACNRFALLGAWKILILSLSMMTAPLRWLIRRARRIRRSNKHRNEKEKKVKETEKKKRHEIRRSTQAILGATIVTLLSLVAVTESCEHAILSSQAVERCEGKDCSARRALILDIDSISKQGCIKFIDEKGRFDGLVSIEIMSNELTCVKTPLGFHREAEIHVASSKRCFGMSSCDGTTCENMTKDTQLVEFDHVSQFPGHSYCSESCGGWECGCLSFHSGCLFFRPYLVPTSQRIYETMKCSTWASQVKLRVNTTIGGTTTSTNLTMREGEFTHKLEKSTGISLLRMEEIERPQWNEILTHDFITDGTRMTHAREVQTNNICQDAQAAEDFKCTAKEKCSCLPTTIRARCDCDQATLEEKFTLEQTLPVRLSSMDVIMNKETFSPQIKVHQGAVKIYLILSENVQRVREHEERIRCTINASELKGFYSSEKGAISTFECTSEQNGQAIVDCEGNVMAIPCGTPSIKTERTLFFERSNVEINCENSCDKKETKVRGTLATPPHLSPSHAMTRVRGGEVPSNEIFPDPTPLIEFVKGHWKMSMIIGLATMMVALLSTVLLVAGPTAVLGAVSVWLRSLRSKRDGRKKSL